MPLLLLFGGCVVPPALYVTSLLAEGFSYAATGKGVADHGISMVTAATGRRGVRA